MIAAIGENRELGKDNALLWSIPEDMRRFKELTTGHSVIMGKNTYLSIGKPLPNRHNIVLCADKDFEAPGCVVVFTLEQALAEAKKNEKEEVFVMGGGQVYKAMLPHIDRLYLTLVEGRYEADTFFPPYPDFKTEVSRVESGDERYRYTFVVLER